MKLGNLCDIVRGSSPRPQGDPRYYGGSIPRLMIADVTRDGMYVTPQIDSLTEEGAIKSRPMKKGDVIIAVSGDPGRACILNIDACIHDGFVGLRNLDETKLYKPYLLSYLSFFKSTTKKGAVGAIFQNLTTDQIKKIDIPEIDLEDQIRIANILSKAEALISQRKESLRLLDELLKSTFLEMFGDPVRNEKGWDIDLLEKHSTKISSGSTPLGGKEVYQREGKYFIRSQNIRMNFIDYSDAYCISDEIHNKMTRTWIKKEDVLLNITGASIGRVATYYGEDDQANVNQHVCIIRTIKNKLNPRFLEFLIANDHFQQVSIGSSSGGTREAFTFEMIKNFKIILPPLKLQTQFAHIVEKTEALKAHYQTSLQELENLYGSLSQKAFSSAGASAQAGKGELSLKGGELAMAAEPSEKYAK